MENRYFLSTSSHFQSSQSFQFPTKNIEQIKQCWAPKKSNKLSFFPQVHQKKTFQRLREALPVRSRHRGPIHDHLLHIPTGIRHRQAEVVLSSTHLVPRRLGGSAPNRSLESMRCKQGPLTNGTPKPASPTNLSDLSRCFSHPTCQWPQVLKKRVNNGPLELALAQKPAYGQSYQILRHLNPQTWLKWLEYQLFGL